MDAAVENLWMTRAKPVDNLTTEIFLSRDLPGLHGSRTCARGLRDPLRLIVRRVSVESPFDALFFRTNTYVIVHRFEETIGGRAYQIEVTAVNDRWRAQLRRTPGMPTAMMPFYGQTPDEAARQLAQWLTLANRRQVTPVTS